MILNGKRIFVVDDDEAVRDSLTILLMGQGAQVDAFESGEQFLAAYDPMTGGCLILDIQLTGMSGIELLSRLRSLGQLIPVILVSGNTDASVRPRALRMGAIDLLDKPVDFRVLVRTILKAFERLA